MARKKDTVWHIVGINGESCEKEIEIDLSYVINKIGYLISENKDKFIKSLINKGSKIKIKMNPNAGFVIKI